MKSKLLKKEKGFTIIEVLIVLAIAGLIILIVFLAVPALQRNSRNTQRKNDVSALLGAVQEAVNNNQGNLPTASGDFTGNVKFSNYSAGDVDYSNTGVTTAPGADTTKIYVRSNSKCTANANTVAASGATKRNVIAYYWVETSSGTTPQCQDM